MKKSFGLLSLGLLAFLASAFVLSSFKSLKSSALCESEHSTQETLENETASKIQVVFALDCTGSMGGLIQAAKDKIWSIATSMSQTQSAVDISFGFVFYRDKGDQFVTKHIQLTSDMDMVYRELMDMQARGGGDTPESVNQALFESIQDFKWDTSKTVYKVVFLVGDAPPHMDYANDVKYPETCHQAIKKDIIINTIQCGDMRETTPIWKDIAQRGGGEYLQLGQTGNEVVIRCPQDTEISRLMDVIDGTRIYYGTFEMRVKSEEKVKASEKIKGQASADVQAKRAEFNYSNENNNASYLGSNELISDLQAGKVKLENVPTEQLPENMKTMTVQQRKDYVETMIAKRKEAEAKLAIQLKERSVYVEKETEKLGEDAVNASFSGQVHQVLVNQAKSKNIEINKKVKN
jgi:Mg-chelatase subunit ChlD